MSNNDEAFAEADILTDDQEVTIKLVTVVVGEQLIGIPIAKVRDVFVASAITPVPLAPRDVAGLVNLRGKVVTVLSMRRIMGFDADESAQMTVGIEWNGEAFGLLIDEVGEVIDVPEAALDRNPPHLDWRWAAISAGIRRWNDRLLIQLDTDILLQKSAA